MLVLNLKMLSVNLSNWLLCADRVKGSSFKHMVYGLRYYYRLLGMNKNAIALPSMKKDKGS